MRIQIIDDDFEVGEILTLMLKKEGYQVDYRDTVDGALEELVKNKPDLLLLDVMFPENPAGGFDLARAIRQHAELEDLPVILLTAVNQEFPMDFSAKDIDDEWMPVHEFVEKPVKISMLREMINKLLSPGSN